MSSTTRRQILATACRGAGLIAMFVGLVELLLEFVKPVTLSMRLFGNVYGGEVALGVILALTVAFVPVALYGLEAPDGVENLTKIVAGKQLWNYDKLEPSEKKLVL